MKTKFLALAALVCFGRSLAFSQDPTVAIPTERSEAAAAESSPPPNESSSPAPKRKASDTAPKKSATPAPGKMGAEATVRDLENKWVASVATHDPSVAQKLLADDYAGVSARGQVMNKRVLLAQIKRDTDVYSSTRISKMEVRVFGNVAVAIGTSTEDGKDRRGTAFTRAYRWTDTWAMRNGVWQCVASQSAQVPR